MFSISLPDDDFPATSYRMNDGIVSFWMVFGDFRKTGEITDKTTRPGRCSTFCFFAALQLPPED